MPVGIVELFEIIDIEHRDSQRQLMPFSSFILFMQAFHAVAAVEQTGKFIYRGQDFQFFHEQAVVEEWRRLVNQVAALK